MVKKLLKRGAGVARKDAETKGRPENHVSMKLGEGWHRRNYLTEILLPSLFSPREKSLPKPLPEIPPGGIGITWIGHASFLIRTAERSLLIDPNWARWLKVIKRLKEPGLAIHQLPSIDLVLVSHAHFDHLDRKSLRAVASEQPIVVPENVGDLVQGLGFDRVHELKRWECLEFGSLRITLTPAHHWGARVLHDDHRGFGGFVIEHGGKTVFHCGDSAWFEGFAEIGERWKIDAALLPIGAYETPSGRDVHMNPEEALRAFEDLKAGWMVPMHYGTFRLGFESMGEPPDRLLLHASERGLGERLKLLAEGETLVL